MITEDDAAEITGQLIQMQDEFLFHAEKGGLLKSVAVLSELNTRLIDYINDESLNNYKNVQKYRTAFDHVENAVTDALKEAVEVHPDGTKISFDKEQVEEMIRVLETFNFSYSDLMNMLG